MRGMRSVRVSAAAAFLALAGIVGAVASASASTPVLVLYSAQGYDQAEATAFQQATGIKVELSDMSTGPLLAKVQAEKQNPQWDVIWFDGNGAMSSLNRQGMLLQGWTPNDVGNYNKLGVKLLPPNHGFFPTGVTAAGALVYNTKLVSAANAPHTWQDLLKPEFRNAVGMNNPAISGPTYPLVAGMFQLMGVNRGMQYFEALKRNGLKIFPTNGNTLQALLNGTIKVAMFQDSAEINAKLSNDPVNVIYPTTGVTMLPSDIAINAKAPDMAVAKRFVQFVLSGKGQKVMQDIKDAGSDSLFQPVTKVINPLYARTGVKWNVVSPVWAGTHQAAWTQWFTDNIVR
jgi:iron(III) transport system substrate-binding protein